MAYRVKPDTDGECASNFRTRGGRDMNQGQGGDAFSIGRPWWHQGSSPLMGQPQVLGSYSVDSEGNYVHNQSALKFIERKYIPDDEETMKVNFDLNRGWEKVTKYNGSFRNSFDNMLKWILSNQKQLAAEGPSHRLHADFISLPGPFSEIMRTLYFPKTDWTILVQHFRGSLYILPCSMESSDGPPKPLTAKNMYGEKFEHYMIGGNPDEAKDTNEEFRCAVRLQLDQLSLLYAHKLEAADPDLYEDPISDLHDFLVVRTASDRTDTHGLWLYRKFKLSRYWVTSKLSGTPRVVVGFRNEEGVVHTLKMYHTGAIPDVAQGEWEPSVCVNFLVKFLGYVRRKVEAKPSCIHRFTREHHDNLIHHTLETSQTKVLPDWYTEQLFSPENSQQQGE